jgi:hypothetical protein
MSVERTYKAESPDGNLQRAIEAAREQLNNDLSGDATASWTVTEISGVNGGWEQRHSITVKIVAKRTPSF